MKTEHKSMLASIKPSIEPSIDREHESDNMKEKEKITPGPWEAGVNENMYTDLSGHGGKAIYHGTHHVGWANVENEDEDLVMDEAVANALLMAASPDMYEMLGSIHEYLQGKVFNDISEQCVNEFWIDEIEKVMRKARGEK